MKMTGEICFCLLSLHTDTAETVKSRFVKERKQRVSRWVKEAIGYVGMINNSNHSKP